MFMCSRRSLTPYCFRVWHPWRRNVSGYLAPKSLCSLFSSSFLLLLSPPLVCAVGGPQSQGKLCLLKLTLQLPHGSKRVAIQRAEPWCMLQHETATFPCVLHVKIERGRAFFSLPKPCRQVHSFNSPDVKILRHIN